MAPGYDWENSPSYCDALIWGPAASEPMTIAEFLIGFSPEADHVAGAIRFDWFAFAPNVRIKVWRTIIVSGDEISGYVLDATLYWSSGIAPDGTFEADTWAEGWRIEVASVPEPASALVLLSGFGLVAFRRRR